MGVSSRRGRMVAGVGSVVAIAAIALFGAAGPANAGVENPPLVTGTPVITADCSESVATFTVTVPKVGIDADAVDGNFWIDGAAVGVESFTPLTTFEPFVRSVDVPLAELPATLSVSYGFDGGTILAAQPFAFTVEGCGVTPPPVVEFNEPTTDTYCEGTTSFGVVRVGAVVPEGAAAVSLGVVYGNEQSLGGLAQVSASGEYSFSGALPAGDTPFTVVRDGQFAVGEGILTVKSCETPTTPPSGEEQPNPPKAETENTSFTPKEGGQIETGDTVPASATASQVSPAMNPLGYVAGAAGIAAFAVLAFGVVYLVRQRRAQSAKG